MQPGGRVSRSRRVIRTPAERAHGTAGSQASRRLAGLIARGLMGLSVHGREDLPAGGVLLAVNHASFLDGPLVFGVLPRPGTFFVKAEVFTGILGWLLVRIGQIPVRRGVPERAPLFTALATLAEGGVVGIFPEGTRGSGDVPEVRGVRHGIAYLALRSGCPVVPVACLGTERVLPKGRRLPRLRQPVTVAFGRPIEVARPGTTPSRQNIAAAAERVRALLADHVQTATASRVAPPAPAPAPGTPPTAGLRSAWRRPAWRRGSAGPRTAGPRTGWRRGAGHRGAASGGAPDAATNSGRSER
jgi:1-acyl-sn-glycerol-3-phosphate acyltransferase